MHPSSATHGPSPWCESPPPTAPRRFVPLYPAGVFDVLPAPLPHSVKRRVRTTEGPLRVLQGGFQLPVESGLGNHLQDVHDYACFLGNGVPRHARLSIRLR